jgi:hypothetical protein
VQELTSHVGSGERKEHFISEPLKEASNSCYSWTKENSFGLSSIQLMNIKSINNMNKEYQ